MADQDPRNENEMPPKRAPRTDKPDPEEEENTRRNRGLLSMILLVLGVLLMVNYLNKRTGLPQIAYGEFKRGIRQHEVASVSIGEQTIRGHLRARSAALPTPPHATTAGTPATSQPAITVPIRGGTSGDFEVVRVAEDRELLPMLEQNDVRYSALEDHRGMVMNVVIVLGILMIVVMGYRTFVKRIQMQQSGVLAFGKSRGKLASDSDVKVRFADVAGVDDAKAELEEIVEFLKSPERFTRLGAKIPKGVLLVGPPGTGKTLLAKAVAGEAAVPFFNISGSEFVEMFVGVGAARVRDLFEQAQASAPCIVFIDELDALGRSRNGGIPGGSEEREQTLNQLLVEMDGFETNKGVIIMAATNRPEILDQALLRPGRFDRQVLVDPPDRKGREAILRVHAKDVILDPDVDLADIASRTPGFAGADLANIINEGALLAARKDLPAVKREHIVEAIDRVGIGLEKKSRVIPEAVRRRIAFHESGHAIVGEVLPGGSKTARISIVPRGMGIGGYVRHMPKEDMQISTEQDLKSMIAGAMGGRAAERIIFGDLSTGASNDLSQATTIARAMVTEYGMSEKMGPISYTSRRQVYLTGDERSTGEYGENIADSLDLEVRRLVEEGEASARAVLEARRPQLEHIASVLLEKEYLDGDELRLLLEHARVQSIPPPAMTAPSASGASGASGTPGTGDFE